LSSTGFDSTATAPADHGTPLGWAKYCDQPAIAEFLKGNGGSA